MKTVSKVLEEFGKEVVGQLGKNLDADKSNASYNLRQSIDYNVEITPKLITWSLSLDSYWKYVDKGRGRGKGAPIESIEEWITEKGIKVQKLTGAKRLKAKKSKRYNAPKSPIAPKMVRQSGTNILKLRRQMAFAISRKIGREGTKGTNFFTKVVNESTFNNLYKELEEAGAKDVESNIDSWIKTL